jgi:hypothetical protein
MNIKSALLLASFIIGLAWLATVAVSNEMLTDATSERLMGAANGLVLAAFGNLIPKTVRRASDARLGEARAQAYRRFAGWTFTLAGLGYALVRLTFPADLARPVSMGLVAGSLVVVLGVCVLGLWKPSPPIES